MEELTADYVIVGSGAVGMAFADIILAESDATMIIIDSYAKPGGHWNVAYPFVQLHQPASFYGVSSKELSGGRTETVGWNAGLGELSTGAEVSAYFDDVMRHQFLPSGRVQYFPLCNYVGDGKFVSKLSGKEYHATATRKTVDATFLKTSVPSTHKPNFTVADDVRFMPLNDLPKITEAPDGYVVIGAGKTGIDACLWLLEQNIPAEMITWVVSREAWLLDRENTQMTEAFFDQSFGSYVGMLDSIVEADSPDDMFDRLERCGYFVRVDESTKPEMFHAATVSKMEIEQLRRIKNVVRMGHVTDISATEITLEQGTVATTNNTVHVDCSASAILNRGIQSVFKGDVITPQMIRPYQPVFSAAMIAHVELNYDDDEHKNLLCGVVPLPNAATDFIFFTAAALMNQYHWSQDKPLQKWIAGNRLDAATTLIGKIAEDDVDKWAYIEKVKELSPKAAMKLFELQNGLSHSYDAEEKQHA